MPELPDTKNQRFVDQYGLTIPGSPFSLKSEKEIADFFEETVLLSSSPVRMIYNWLIGDFARQKMREKLIFRQYL